MAKDAVHGIFIAGLGAAIFKAHRRACDPGEHRTESSRDATTIRTFTLFWNAMLPLFCLAFIFSRQYGGSLTHALHDTGSSLNGLYKSMYGVQPPNMNQTQARLDMEVLRLVMIGPVVVARIFLLLGFAVVPFCAQRRRRARLAAAVKRNLSKVRDFLTLVRHVRRLRSDEDTDDPFFSGSASLTVEGQARILRKASAVAHRRARSGALALDSGLLNFAIEGAENEEASDDTGGIKKEVEEKKKEKDEMFAARFHAIQAVRRYFRGRRAKQLVVRRQLALQVADDIVEEAGLMPFDSFFVYNDLIIQYALHILCHGRAVDAARHGHCKYPRDEAAGRHSSILDTSSGSAQGGKYWSMGGLPPHRGLDWCLCLRGSDVFQHGVSRELLHLQGGNRDAVSRPIYVQPRDRRAAARLSHLWGPPLKL